MDTSVRILQNAVEDLVEYLDGDAKRAFIDDILATMSAESLGILTRQLDSRQQPQPKPAYDARRLLAKALNDPEIQTSIADWVLSEFLREFQSTPRPDPVQPPTSTTHTPPRAGTTPIRIRVVRSFLDYKLIDIPSAHRSRFPGYRIPFRLATDIGTYDVKVTGAVGHPAAGDPSAGRFIKSVQRNGLADWFQRHNFLTLGDMLTISVLEPMRAYRLDVG